MSSLTSWTFVLAVQCNLFSPRSSFFSFLSLFFQLQVSASSSFSFYSVLLVLIYGSVHPVSSVYFVANAGGSCFATMQFHWPNQARIVLSSCNFEHRSPSLGTAGFMKTVSSLYTLYLSQSTQVAEGTILRKHTVLQLINY